MLEVQGSMKPIAPPAPSIPSALSSVAPRRGSALTTRDGRTQGLARTCAVRYTPEWDRPCKCPAPSVGALHCHCPLQ